MGSLGMENGIASNREGYFPSNRSKKFHTTFTNAEITRVYEYLLKYRDLSTHYVSSKPSTDVSADTEDTNGTIQGEVYTMGTMIGDHQFPPLNSYTCTQPYLTLPSTLGSKHRKIIHEMCSLDIDGLYHESLGPKEQRNMEDSSYSSTSTHSVRTMLLSIFVDGFEFHPQWNETSLSVNTNKFSFPIMRCKSWYYLNRNDDSSTISTTTTHSSFFSRNTSTTLHTTLYWAQHYSHIYSHLKSKKVVQDETNVGLRSIRTLVDQPQLCLRENMDEIEIESQNHNHNLAQFPKPCTVHTDSSTTQATFLLVNTVEKIQQCIDELYSPLVHELAFDLEAHNPSKFSQVTCLLQLSTNLGKDYVIDVLAPGVWDRVSLLKPIFANPSIVKVGHNIGALDIPALHRDFGILVVNAFDTQVAAETLRLTGNLGLSKLCEYYGLTNVVEYHALKASHQMQDWRIRPLTASMVTYGVSDVHYLLPLRKLLIRDFCRRESLTLNEDDDNTIEYINRNSLQGFESMIPPPLSSFERQESITSVKSEGFFTPLEGEILNTWEGSMTVHQPKSWSISELRSNSELIDVLCVSQERCLRMWKEENEPLERNETFISIFASSRRSRSSRTWTESNMALYQVLHQYRETISRQHGLNPSMIIPLDLLVMIAYRKPRSIPEIRQLSYILPAFLAAEENIKHRHEIIEIVSLVSSEHVSSNPPFTSYAEFTNVSSDDSLTKEETDLSSHLNLIRWTLVSGAALSWLMLVVKKSHR